MDLRERLYNWLSRQEPWQQDLARRLVDTAELDEPAYSETLRVIKTAFNALGPGEASRPPVRLTPDALPTIFTRDAPRLVRFGKLRGVGAASNDSELEFEKHGLTIVFGQNGTGKSTYVRALKAICRSVGGNNFLHRDVFGVHDADSVPQTAQATVFSGGTENFRHIDLNNPENADLKAVSVFDSTCAELYVNKHNKIAFVPADLHLLSRIATAQKGLRADLAKESEELHAANKPDLTRFDDGTTVKDTLDKLTAMSDTARIRHQVDQLAELSNAEQDRLRNFTEVLNSFESGKSDAESDSAERDAVKANEAARVLTEISNRIDHTARADLQKKASAIAQLKESIQLAAREFEEYSMPGVGGGPWKNLWQAAREFVNANSMEFPPATGSPCPLCLQELSDTEQERLYHFEEHVTSTLQDRLHAEQKSFDDTMSLLDPAKLTPYVDFANTIIRPHDPEFAEKISALFSTLREYATNLCNDPFFDSSPPSSDLVEQLRRWAQERQERADRLRAMHSPEEALRIREENLELRNRDRLRSHRDDIVGWCRTLERVHALGQARKALDTSRISTQQSQLSKQVVTSAMQEKLRHEIEALECSQLPVDLTSKAESGETKLALQLAGAHRNSPKISEIASEGEKRTLSLAFFLAEVGMSDNDSGLIVDDPVSSLDDIRRSTIAHRLAAEATRRQVVVFTHDVAFMHDLKRKADQDGCPTRTQGIWRDNEKTALVDPHPPFKLMRTKERISRLRQRAQEWHKQPPASDQDEQWRRVRNFYTDLRTTWERAVEECLFQGVVDRFQPEVKTQSLKDVKITDAALELVRNGMSKCSTFTHDPASAITVRIPDREELEEDVEAVQELVKLVKRT